MHTITNNRTKILLYGMGKRFKGLDEYKGKALIRDFEIIAVTDSKISNSGSINFGGDEIPVIEPATIRNYDFEYIVVVTGDAFYDEIREKLECFGYKTEQIISVTEFEKKYNELIKLQLVKKYENCDDKDLLSIVEYLNKNPLDVFNAKFKEKYDADECEVYYDSDKKMYYAFQDEKKLYLKKEINTKEQAQQYLSSIRMEQDKESPHCYLEESVQLLPDSVVIDAGVAEGNFALSIIDRVKKVILIESDPLWVEALEYTFAPYRDKITIINKFLSDVVNENSITIDALKLQKIDFIKMDIEGAEEAALQGAAKTLADGNIELAVCVYHKSDAYKNVKNILKEYHANIRASKGYMFFAYEPESYLNPELRRGILRATIYATEK